MNLKGVLAVGEGEFEGKPCVVVLVSPEAGTMVAQLPHDIHGVPVVVKNSGPITAD